MMFFTTGISLVCGFMIFEDWLSVALGPLAHIPNRHVNNYINPEPATQLIVTDHSDLPPHNLSISSIDLTAVVKFSHPFSLTTTLSSILIPPTFIYFFKSS